MANSSLRQIIKNRRVQDDEWDVLTHGDDTTAAEVFLPATPTLLPLDVWQTHQAELIKRGTAMGLWLAPADDVSQIAADIRQFTVIAVHFPKLADGRGYSTARLLRERYGYAGELRAMGDIGRDQLFYLHRVGFDAFVLAEGKNAADALNAFDDFPDTYQSGVDQPNPLFRRRAA